MFRRVRDLTTIAYTRCRRGIHRGAVIATGFVGHEAGVLVTASSSPTGRGDVGFVPLPVAAPLPVSMLTLVSMLALVPVLTLVPVLAIVPVSSLGLHLAAGAAVATVTDAVRAAPCSSPPAVTATATTVVVVLVGAVSTGHFHCAAGTTTSPTTANVVAARTAGSVAGRVSRRLADGIGGHSGQRVRVLTAASPHLFRWRVPACSGVSHANLAAVSMQCEGGKRSTHR